MARRSLRPQLNQIRTWVRQGRTDAWIAHQLEVTVQQIDAFKKENDLLPDAEAGENNAVDFDEDIDLRGQDDALIAAELEREAEEAAEAAEAEPEPEPDEAEPAGDGDDGPDAKPKRSRGRRGGRGRVRRPKADGPLEATFEHGDEGYGLWLDPAVADNPVYAEHWAGHRQVEVSIEEDQIVIRRAGEEPDAADD
jgi:hypothetical protein